MKTVKNLSVSYESPAYNVFNGAPIFDEDGKPITKIIETTYARLIQECISKPENPQTGFDYEEIVTINELREAIKNEQDGEIKLEDSTFKYIFRRVNQMKWGVATLEFVKFKDYMKEVNDTKPKKIKAEETTKAE